MVNLTIAGVSYPFPQDGDEQWGDNVTDWAIAVSSKLLQKSGGLFQLTSEVDFGTTYGVKSAYFKSRGTTPATSGVIRLASAEAISWMNNAGLAALPLTTDVSDNLTFNGHIISSSSGVVPVAAGGTGISSYSAGDLLTATGATTLSKLAIGSASKVLTTNGTAPSWNLLVNANIDAAAAIAYSKLALTGSIVNADVNASAAIAYSKLALTGAILNADLAGSIAYSKLVLTGSIVNADVNASAAIAYSKLTLTGSIVNADVNASAAIAYTKLALTGTIVNADVSASAAIAYSKLALTGAILNADLAGSIAASKLVGSDIATVGTVTTGTWSATTIALNKGGTGQTTKQPAFDALSPLSTKGDLLGFSTVGARLAVGTDGFLLTADAASTLGFKWAAAASKVVQTKTTTYTMLVTDDAVLGSTGSSWTLSLFTAVGNGGKIIYLTKTSNDFNVWTIDANGSETIGGALTITLNTLNENAVLISDNANWQIISRTYPEVWTAYTPTCTGFGTVSTNSGFWKRSGHSILTRGKFTAGTATAVEARVSLPTGITSESSTYIPTIIHAGEFVQSGNGALVMRTLIEPSVTYTTFSWQGAGNNSLTKINGNDVGTGTTVSWDATVPVVGWNL